MSTARIAPLEGPFDAAIAESFSRVMPAGKEPLKLFRTMARSPRVLQRMFAGALLDPGSISMRERELVILRTCARCGSEYEWGVHAEFFSGRAGIDRAQLAASCGDTSENGWSERDSLLVRLVDELHDSADVSDALWESLAAEFAPEQLLELIALAGYYHTISFLTNALRVELEPYAPRFPETKKYAG